MGIKVIPVCPKCKYKIINKDKAFEQKLTEEGLSNYWHQGCWRSLDFNAKVMLIGVV